jgi:hypothetical protein
MRAGTVATRYRCHFDMSFCPPGEKPARPAKIEVFLVEIFDFPDAEILAP